MRLGVVLVLAWALGACQSRPPAPPDLESALQVLAQTGYRPQASYGVAELHEVWHHGDRELDVSFVAPASSGDAPFPLLVYLPGLGELSSAGALWRRDWAQAGYAVLSVQPLTLTQRIWGSPQALNGDFRALAWSNGAAQGQVGDRGASEVRRHRRQRRLAGAGEPPRRGAADVRGVARPY